MDGSPIHLASNYAQITSLQNADKFARMNELESIQTPNSKIRI